MCSIDEIEQVGDNIKSKKGENRRDKGNRKNFAGEGSCMKCPEKAVVHVRNNDPFCRTCFLDYIVHKFRATIGKARVIHQGERVLLAVSGGSASSTMLDLVIEGLSKAAVKKHRFQPGVVHVDDEGLCGHSVHDRNNVKHHIEELARSAGFPYHHASLADLFIQQGKETSLERNLHELDILNEEQNISNEISKRTKSLREVFEKVTTVTAREDLLSHLYRNLLQRIAKDHGYDYIMVGDCGTNIAVRILADIAQGRGSQLPLSVSFKDSRSEVPVLRPMREFTKKEIQFYNCFSDVTSFTIPSFTTKASSHGSVNRLTEELIFGLQAGFPSTVSTVLRTGDKISSNVDRKDGLHCVLCLAPLGVNSGFSEAFSELTTCSGGECGTGGCQKTDGGDGIGGGGTDGHDDTLRHMGTHSDSLESAYGIDGSFGGITITGSGKICGTSGHSGTLGSVGDGTHRDSSGHSGTLGSVGDGTLRGISGHSDTPGSVGDGTLRGSSGHSGIPDTHIGGDQSTDDHNILLKSLCYGCMLTYHDIKDGQMVLQTFLTENPRKQFQQGAMNELACGQPPRL
ncbi:cytoplasmic tRNA 2-thiolation 2-A-like [Paramuricea clavata]|uniref:Cytoplasmic tRNA 2-thiolation protein 2 n=1 Tax=Paramuricea clavata TaxID=317549 RepID=A0A6S7IKJ4_PARCT|nr:cytoplasmic tRNA 2-thiolation 2-A-like [Paramuricea clavata]